MIDLEVVPEKKVKDEMFALNPADATIALIVLTDGNGSPARKRQNVCAVERIIMRKELTTDETINQPQQLLKSKYQKFNGHIITTKKDCINCHQNTKQGANNPLF